MKKIFLSISSVFFAFVSYSQVAEVTFIKGKQNHFHNEITDAINYIGLDTFIFVIATVFFVSALIIASYGKKKEIGYRKAFMNSIFLTPVGGMIMVGISRKLTECNHCGNLFHRKYDFCPGCQKNEDRIDMEDLEGVTQT